MDYYALFVLGALIAVMLGVSLWTGRSARSESDYLVGGRDLGVILCAFSLFATWFGAETILATAGAVAKDGLAGGRADPFGYALCLILFSLLVAYRMRAGNYLTSADFYRERFGAIAEKISAALLIPTSLIWAAAQIIALANILSQITGLGFDTALLAGSAVVIAAATLGGFRGDVFSDFILGIVLIIGVMALAAYTTMSAGGAGPALAKFTPARLSLFSPDETPLAQADHWVIAIVGSLVSQEMIARFLGARTPAIARKACYLAAILYFAAAIVPVYIGLAGGGIIPGGGGGPDSFLPDFARAAMPEAGYLALVGVLAAAILTTINSNLLAIGALAGRNLVIPIIARGVASDSERLQIQRVMVVIAGLMTYAIASSGQSLYNLVEASSSFGSAGLLTCFLFGLWGRIGGPAAALATMAAGLVSAFLFQYYWAWDGGFMASLAASVAVYVAVATIEGKGILRGASYAGG